MMMKIRRMGSFRTLTTSSSRHGQTPLSFIMLPESKRHSHQKDSRFEDENTTPPKHDHSLQALSIVLAW